MFWQSYKTTIKNLTRSGLFWAMVAAVFFVLAYSVMSSSLSIIDLETREAIRDTDPRFVMPDTTYAQLANHTDIRFMRYAMPCLIVVSVMLILNRDFGDNYFEIEHAGGINPSHYFLGRFAALVSVHLLIAAIALPLGFYWYYFSRGGLPGLSNLLANSAERLLRQYFLSTAPLVLMYLGVAYLIGCLFQSGLASAIGGIGLVLFHDLASTSLKSHMPEWYRFFAPDPIGKHAYLSYYDRYSSALTYSFTPTEMAIWTSVMLGMAILCFAVSYWRTYRREI